MADTPTAATAVPPSHVPIARPPPNAAVARALTGRAGGAKSRRSTSASSSYGGGNDDDDVASASDFLARIKDAGVCTFRSVVMSHAATVVIFSALATAVLLLMRPPFLYTVPDDPLERPCFSWTRTSFASACIVAVVALATYRGPDIVAMLFASTPRRT